MNYVIWLFQVLLGLVIGAGGFEKVFAYDKMLHQYAWVKDVSPSLVAFIGVCEMLGGMGLILPALTRVMPRLTPIAASALVLLMALAGGFHVMRGEFHSLIPVTVLGCLFAFIAYGRFKLSPIQPKNP